MELKIKKIIAQEILVLSTIFIVSLILAFVDEIYFRGSTPIWYTQLVVILSFYFLYGSLRLILWAIKILRLKSE